MHEHDEVVRLADDAPVRQALGAAPGALGGSFHHPAGLPWPVQVLVEHRHGDVEDQRGQDSSNASGNFCFEVTLGYRRCERPRRAGVSV